MANTVNGSLANLVATIDSVALGGVEGLSDDEHETHVVTAEMLEGTVLHLSDGQSINVVQMSDSLEDGINVVQVETTELGDHISSVEEICGMEIDTEEQKHILSETGAHVVVKTENEVIGTLPGRGHALAQQTMEKSPMMLPSVPFSFPGQTFDTKCQKLILNVWDFFRRVKKNPDILDEIRTPQERAAAALHISAATIGKIGKNFKRTGKLETPGRKRKRAKPVVDSVNAEHEQVIRSIIKEFKDSRVTPTLPLILNECRERINFQGGATSFRRILVRMGFKGLSTSKMSSSSNTSSPSKYKSITSSSNVATYSKSSNSQSMEALKSIDQDHSFLSLPISTPTPSPTKKVAFRAVIPSSSSPSKMESQYNSSNLASRVVNLLGNNVLQLGTTAKGEPITISQQTAAALAQASSRLGDGPQTIHVLQPDNTIQQIQILYANMT